MNVSLSEVKLISMSGYKSQLKVYPEDSVDVDGVAFVRLKPFCTSLVHMVYEGNTLAPVHSKNATLSNCRGMMEMLRARNKASGATRQAIPASSCSLFANPDDDKENDAGPRPKKPRQRMPAVEMKAQREAREQIEIDITVDGNVVSIPVLKAVHPRDALFVKYDPEVLGCVLKCFRDDGFEEPKAQNAHPNVYQRAGFILAVHKPEGGGKTRYKKVKDVEDALTWQAEMLNVDGETPPSEHSDDDNRGADDDGGDDRAAEVQAQFA